MIFFYIFVAFHVPRYTDGCPSMSTIFIPVVSILINYNTWPLYVFSFFFFKKSISFASALTFFWAVYSNVFSLHESHRWMKPPCSNFCLEGFFLRLRLGKWEEGLGGTGYHVACISGKLAFYYYQTV